MRGQLERLIEATRELDVTIRILPLDSGPHPGMEGAFTILTLPELASDVGYIEGIMGGALPGKPGRCTSLHHALRVVDLDGVVTG